MNLKLFRAFWGMTEGWAERIAQIAADGYDGAELWVDAAAPAPADLLPLLAEHGLSLIVATRVIDAAAFAPTLERLAAYQPLKINIQGGRDSMTPDEGSDFLQAALDAARGVTVPVLHETHRGCLFFTPWTTAAYLRQFPEIRLTADFSHWVNVCERLPADQAEALALACGRALHIHGRVGYEEGPQVPDPAAPEYAAQLAWHEAQWLKIGEAHRAAGAAELTFTPEYGPPHYLHTLPYTGVPVANLRQVCLWGAERARALFD